MTGKPVACKTATGKPFASSNSDCQGGPKAEKIEWSHNLHVSPATIHHTEAAVSIVREIYGREHDDPVDDLDVNAAIWGIFLNATLRAIVHLGLDHAANLRHVKNNIWNSAGQLLRETGKLISEQKESTGLSTIDFKGATWMSTSLLCERLIKSPTPKHTSSPTLCSAWEKLEMILLRPGRVFGKESLPGYESNRGYADGVRVDNIPRNHSVGPPREDSKFDERHNGPHFCVVGALMPTLTRRPGCLRKDSKTWSFLWCLHDQPCTCPLVGLHPVPQTHLSFVCFNACFPLRQTQNLLYKSVTTFSLHGSRTLHLLVAWRSRLKLRRDKMEMLLINFINMCPVVEPQHARCLWTCPQRQQRHPWKQSSFKNVENQLSLRYEFSGPTNEKTRKTNSGDRHVHHESAQGEEEGKRGCERDKTTRRTCSKGTTDRTQCEPKNTV